VVPKGPLILGIPCVVFVVVSIIGINSSEEFSSFMQMPPEKYKIIADSKDLSEINKKALHYKEIEDEQGLTLQTKLMKEKQEEIVSDIVGYDVMAWVDKFNFPYVDTVEIREWDDPFEICTIPEKIPIHLENISKDKVFELFAKKYSNHHVQVTIQDERRDKSYIHYQFTAVSSENEDLTATIMYHPNSCTDGENYHASLNCLDHETKQNSYSRFADSIINSLNDDNSFCMITLEDWQQSLREYSKKISERAEIVHEKIMHTMTDENFDQKIMSPLFEESDKLQLLQRISSFASDSLGANEFLEENIVEYKSKYGDLPEDLQLLLNARPPNK